jgi:MoaA/NifB/PqqE/SkfB family radical SAM enzyme
MDIYRHVKQLRETKYKGAIFFNCEEEKPGEPFLKAGPDNREHPCLTVFSRPVMVICETVNSCCNDCIICPYRSMTRKKETMPLELFEKLLKDYSAMGGGKLSLTPKMGDIFFDELLIERLDLIKKYPKITGISVTTNAILSDQFSDKELQDIVSSFEKIMISVYGIDAEEYFLMTRRNTYQRMIDTIARILSVSKRPHAIELGFRLLKQRSQSDVDAWIMKNFHTKIASNVTSLFMDWGGSLDATKMLPFSGKWRCGKANVSQCLIPLAACLIFSNGDVSFCSCNDYDIKDEFRLGNIADHTLGEIINSPKNEKLWASPLNLPKSCKFCGSHRSFKKLENYSYVFENPLEFIGG